MARDQSEEKESEGGKGGRGLWRGQYDKMLGRAECIGREREREGMVKRIAST